MNEAHNTLSLPLAEAIEDSILFGHITEIDDMLKVISIDDDFPAELRYGLEALRHFRAHYGKGGDLEPSSHLQKQKTSLIENAWGAELLDRIKRVKDAGVSVHARFN